MSAMELRALLADAANNGAYFIDVRDREAMDEAALSLDFKVAAIDLAGCAGKDEVLARFAQALAFPDWFGGNWDALADCLGDLSWWPAPGYLLLLDHVGGWRDDEPAGFAMLLEILGDAAQQRAAQALPFWVLIPLSATALQDIDAG